MDGRSSLPFKIATTAAAGLYGYYAYLGTRTPIPGLPQEVAGGLDVERHEFVTPDGLTLRLKRYANPDGPPVLLCHGFGSNGGAFDLPRKDINMAVHLARAGFDVWISSWRGCGHDPYESDGGDWTHSIDTLAIYDAPTLVEGVAEVTGKRVYWIGHSMGGHILYMFLQGVRFEDGHVVSDPALVRRHHEQLAGGVTIGSPPAFWYPKGNPYYLLFKSKPGAAVINAGIQQMLLKEVTAPRIVGIGGMGNALDGHPRAVMALSRTPFVISTYCRRNTTKDATTCLALFGQGDASAGMYVQLFQAIAEGTFLEHPGRAEPGQQYDYTDNMDLVSLPLLFLTGNYDFANPGAIKRFGYERVSSDIKQYVNLPGYGHTDLLMGRNAAEDVYPMISSWLNSLAKEQDRT